MFLLDLVLKSCPPPWLSRGVAWPRPLVLSRLENYQVSSILLEVVSFDDVVLRNLHHVCILTACFCLLQDPLSAGTQANTIMLDIRKRKGLKPEPAALNEYEGARMFSPLIIVVI